MAFPKFDSKTFRNAALGLTGAVAAATMVVGPSAAEDRNVDPAPSFLAAEIEHAATLGAPNTGTAAPVETSSVQTLGATDVYSNLGVPQPTEPNADQPYYTYTFDENMLAAHPDFSPLNLQAFEYDKILIYNFIDNSPQGRRFSDMQTQVLDQTLDALAPISEAKDIMLVNVVTNAENGDPVYGAAFLSLYKDENGLGPDGTPLDNIILPYGIVYGESLREDGAHRLFDFALLNGVRTNADLNANADAIAASMHSLIVNYNKKNLAALESDGQSFVASLH